MHFDAFMLLVSENANANNPPLTIIQVKTIVVIKTDIMVIVDTHHEMPAKWVKATRVKNPITNPNPDRR